MFIRDNVGFQWQNIFSNQSSSFGASQFKQTNKKSNLSSYNISVDLFYIRSIIGLRRRTTGYAAVACSSYVTAFGE